MIWIRTVAGASIGFGHLRRSLVLSGLLEEVLEPVLLLDDSDTGSRTLATAQGRRCISFNPDTLWKELPVPGGILIDTRESDGTVRLVEEARVRKIPVISIHDLGLAPLPSDIAIDGSILPASDKSAHRGTTHYTGTRYLILDPMFSSMHRRHKRVAEKIKLVIVSLGGGDSKECFAKVLQGLRLSGRNLDVVGFPGFARWGQEELAQIDWRPLRFRWAGPAESVAGLLFRADLAVTAGGLSVYEAACVGTPVMALAVDGFQEITVSRLSNAGACVNLGLVEPFQPPRMSEAISRIACDRKLRVQLSLRGRQTVDGRGAERVSLIVREKVLEHAGILA